MIEGTTRHGKMTIADMMVNEAIITKQQKDELLAEMDEEKGITFEKLLVDKGLASEEHIVRRATADDIPGILKLLVQVDMVHHNGRPDLFKGPATKYNETELAGIIANESTPVFVLADSQGNVKGHAFTVHKQVKDSAVITDVRTLYVDDICVDEACRRQGIGRLLYDAVRDYAKTQGFYNITLNVWNCNPSAMKFYESLGLVPQKVCMEEVL